MNLSRRLEGHISEFKGLLSAPHNLLGDSDWLRLVLDPKRDLMSPF